MLQHPIKREQAHIEVTQYALPHVVDTVFKVSFVHLRYCLLISEHLREVRPVVVAPEPEQAVQLMCAHRHRHISAPSDLGELRRCLQAMATADADEVLLCSADDAVLLDRVPCFDNSRRWRALEGRVVPERAIEACLDEWYGREVFAHGRC